MLLREDRDGNRSRPVATGCRCGAGRASRARAGGALVRRGTRGRAGAGCAARQGCRSWRAGVLVRRQSEVRRWVGRRKARRRPRRACAAGHMGGRAWPGEAAREVATRGTSTGFSLSPHTPLGGGRFSRGSVARAGGGPCGARGRKRCVRGGSVRGGTPGAGACGERANEPALEERQQGLAGRGVKLLSLSTLPD